MGGLRTGTAVVIISPTRELALQIFQVASDLMKYHHQTFGIIMGGANRYDGWGAARAAKSVADANCSFTYSLFCSHI